MASNNDITLPSVCLPRIYHKYDKNYVEGIFCELFGPDSYGNSCVRQIDIIKRTDRNTSEPFNVVFVHFSEQLPHSDFLADFAERINNREEVKIQYNPPWFWKVRKNTSTPGKDVRTGPRIMSRKDEEELMQAQREIVQKRNNSSVPQQHLGRAQDKGALNNGTKWADLADEEDEEALNRLKEEAEKATCCPPPLEWGEDADVAKVR